LALGERRQTASRCRAPARWPRKPIIATKSVFTCFSQGLGYCEHMQNVQAEWAA
jgi:hypothetical protein